MNDVANTNKDEYELIENNLLAFNLFKSEEDKKTTDIFAISSPFEYALPQPRNEDNLEYPRSVKTRTIIGYVDILCVAL